MNKINLTKYTILIVDDIVENLVFLSELLEPLDYSITFAKNGKEAIESVKKIKPDLILLDLMMPVMDGLQCCEKLKADPNYKDIPVLFITASKEQEDLTKAFELGGCDYVTKPFKIPELLMRIKHQLTISQQAKDIQEKNLALESTNKKLENFNRMICHDIRNPLTNIKGFVYLLEYELTDKLTEKEKELLECIDTGTNQINDIIESLIVLSELKKWDITTFYEVNLSDIVQEILSQLKKQNRDRQSQFIIPPDIFAIGEKRVFTVGLENLLKNAWKYSSKKEKTIIEFGTTMKNNLIKNEVHIPIDILVTLKEDEIIYFIKDNGAGFDQEQSDQMFEVFHRLHTKDEFEGSGIGLAIVESVINYLGGKIWANGKINEGATFYFSLATQKT